MPPRHYRFGPVALTVHAGGGAVDTAVQSVFGHLGVPESPPAPPGAGRLVVSLGVGGAEVPTGGREIDLSDGFVRAWDAAPLLVLAADDGGGPSVLRLDAGAGRGEGRLDPGLLDRPQEMTRQLHSLLVSGINVLLRPHGLHPLHAAALDRGGAGLLLVADSDHGKSTLAYGLVRAGWSTLSDDTVLIDAGGEGIEVAPFRRHFGLDVVAAEVFPELAGGSHGRFAGEDKWLVDVGGRFPDRVAERSTPRVLVLPEIADADESRVEPATAAEAHYALVRQSTLPTWDADAARGHLDALARLVAQTRPYRFFGGRDVLRHPARASELLLPLLTDD